MYEAQILFSRLSEVFLLEISFGQILSDGDGDRIHGKGLRIVQDSIWVLLKLKRRITHLEIDVNFFFTQLDSLFKGNQDSREKLNSPEFRDFFLNLAPEILYLFSTYRMSESGKSGILIFPAK